MFIDPKTAQAAAIKGTKEGSGTEASSGGRSSADIKIELEFERGKERDLHASPPTKEVNVQGGKDNVSTTQTDEGKLAALSGIISGNIARLEAELSDTEAKEAADARQKQIQETAKKEEEKITAMRGSKGSNPTTGGKQ